jgi:intein/homing endonuclease
MINKRLTMSKAQPIHTANGWGTAENLQIGDLLTTIGGPELLTDVSSTSGSVVVYNITVEPYHQFYANGFLVHNKI